MRAYADRNPERSELCDRCHCWYLPEDVARVGDGTWQLCTGCIEALDIGSQKIQPTHEGDFEDEPVEYETAPFTEHPNALLHRTSAGLHVEACYLPLTDLYGVSVTLDGRSFWVSVEADQLLDAYNHPALYLGAERCKALGLK